MNTRYNTLCLPCSVVQTWSSMAYFQSVGDGVHLSVDTQLHSCVSTERSLKPDACMIELADLAKDVS